VAALHVYKYDHREERGLAGSQRLSNNKEDPRDSTHGYSIQVPSIPDKSKLQDDLQASRGHLSMMPVGVCMDGVRKTIKPFQPFQVHRKRSPPRSKPTQSHQAEEGKRLHRLNTPGVLK
jgi:hypothetical protein